ncbi:hypothetical protein PVAG01_07079 [Phlyctema vagabunda]|uniref:AB hydrolase-1 domain-containing protein n=1 Tax=Phlyctema vagabunda TaxID=108571 RepID=A0ABR4PBE6_9HELO
MKLSSITRSISLLWFASQGTSRTFESSQRTCHNYSIPVNVTNVALVASYEPFTSNYDVVNFANGLAGREGGASLNLFSGQATKTGIYDIGATICSPNTQSENETTIIVASHGLGYDRRYWDSGIEAANYSFVDFAISQGYTVFFYDRLGTGESTKVSGYEEPQSLTQVAILRQLTILLRSGQYTGDLNSLPSKIVHVGHSYGSFISNGLIATTPQLSDGVILTGIAYAGVESGALIEAFGLRIANTQAPGKWPGRDNEYVTWVDAIANVGVFFRAGSFDDEVLWYTEYVKQPIAIAELISIGSEQIFPRRAVGFTKPVMVLSGEFDFPFCGYNCNDILDNGGETKATYFPNSSDFQAVVHPGVGHGINFSYNATGAYKAMTDYLKKNSL